MARPARRPIPGRPATGLARPAALVALLALLGLVACAPPESLRGRGGGPGADVGNRGASVELHGRTDPAHDTPAVGQAVRK
jgi:hypothetical protein